jgi:hypothetical protein
MDLEGEIAAVAEQIERRDGDLSFLTRRQHALHERYQEGGGLTYRSRTRGVLLGLGFSAREFDMPAQTLTAGSGRGPASPAFFWEAPACSFWTSRRTISTSRPANGWRNS